MPFHHTQKEQNTQTFPVLDLWLITGDKNKMDRLIASLLPMPKRRTILRDFWQDNYFNRTIALGGLCGLCANTGIIDTTTTAISPKGIMAGGKYYCVCPNGRNLQAKAKWKNEHKSYIERSIPCPSCGCLEGLHNNDCTDDGE